MTGKGSNTRQAETTAKAVLDSIENKLETSEAVELTDDEMYALRVGVNNPAVPTRQSVVNSKRRVEPVRYLLYHVSDVEGHGRGECLAMEIHSNQQGERQTRPYAKGIGNPEFKPANVPSLETLRGAAQDRLAKDVPVPTDGALERIREEIELAHREVIDILFDGTVWAAAFTGNELYIEPDRSRWEGFEHAFDEANLTYEQRRAIKASGSEWAERPQSLDVTSSFTFSYDVEFGQ